MEAYAAETDQFKTSKEEIHFFLEREFLKTKCQPVEVGSQTATIAHEIGEADLRPGRTVSGPVMTEAADVSLCVALLSLERLESYHWR